MESSLVNILDEPLTMFALVFGISEAFPRMSDSTTTNAENISSGSTARPWRVLFLNSVKFMGGGETWMINMARHLGHRGHYAVIVARPDSPLLERAVAMGMACEALRISGDLNPIAYWKLAAIIRKHRIEVIIANISRDIRIAGILSRLGMKIPVIGLQQVDVPIADKWNYRLTFNSLASVVVVNSEATRETLRNASPWLDQSRIRVIPHGIDPADFATADGGGLRASLGIGKGTFVVGFVGRFAKQKGIATLLKAIELIEKRNPTVQFLIAGHGPLENRINRFLESRPHAKQLGFRKDVPSVMQACDVLLVPSIWEGFGLVVVEAMAVGTPCVASRVSSLPEIIEDDSSGILVPPEDAEAIADAVDRLVASPELREKLSAQATQRLLTHFTVGHMINAYEAVFDAFVQSAGENRKI